MSEFEHGFRALGGALLDCERPLSLALAFSSLTLAFSSLTRSLTLAFSARPLFLATVSPVAAGGRTLRLEAELGECGETRDFGVGTAVAFLGGVRGVQTSSYAVRALGAAVFCLAFVLLTGCQSSAEEEPIYAVPVTEGPELDVVLSTDLAVPQDIDSIRIERSVPDISARPISTDDYELGPTDPRAALACSAFQIYSQQPESDPATSVFSVIA